MKSKIIYILFIALSVVLVFFKLTRLYNLEYHIDDFINNLQGSYSYIDGRPLTYANGFGPMLYAHNYFLMPLLGPWVYSFGIKGQFILIQLLYFWAYCRYYQIIGLTNFVHRLVFLFLFASPTFLWLYDHPWVGFTYELFYLPLSCLYALELKARHKSFWVWGILLCMVREEGIILTGIIYTAYRINANGYASLFEVFKDRLLLQRVALLVLLFFVTFASLQWRNPTSSFINASLQNFNQNIDSLDFIKIMTMLFLKTFLILCPTLAILYFVISKLNTIKIQVLVGSFLVIFLILSVHTFKYIGSIYLDTISMTWVPRFILLFSALAAMTIIYVDKENTKTPFKIAHSFLFVMVYFVQIPIIAGIRPDVDIDNVLNSRIKKQAIRENKKFYNDTDIKLIRKIEKALPSHSNVYVFEYLVSIFADHYIIFFNTDKEYEKADLAIIPKPSEFSHFYANLNNRMKPDYKKIAGLNFYDIYTTKAYEAKVLSTLKNLEKSGTK